MSKFEDKLNAIEERLIAKWREHNSFLGITSSKFYEFADDGKVKLYLIVATRARMRREGRLVLDKKRWFYNYKNESPRSSIGLEQSASNRQVLGSSPNGDVNINTFSAAKEATLDERQKLEAHSRNQMQHVKSANAVEGTEMQAVRNKQNPQFKGEVL